MLGRKQIGERRIDDRRAELGRYRGERALRSLACFDTFDGADVDELEGRLGAKAAAAAGVDRAGSGSPGWMSPQRLLVGGLGRRNGCGAWSSAGGRRLAGGRALPRVALSFQSRTALGGAGSVETDLATGAISPTIAGNAADGGLHRNRTTVERLGNAGAIPMAASMASPRKTRRRLAR